MMGSTKTGLIHCRRLILTLGMGLLLAGCQIIPQVDPPYSPPPPSQPTGQQGTTDDRRTPPPIERDRPTPLPRGGHVRVCRVRCSLWHRSSSWPILAGL